MKTGIIFGTFAPMHLGHLDVIKTADTECEKICVACCGHVGDRGYPLLPIEKRTELAREALVDITQNVILFPDTDPGIKKNWSGDRIWKYWTDRMRIRLTEERITDYFEDELIWYTSEEEYRDVLEEAGCRVRLCGRVRPVSGTAIREDPFRYLDSIAEPFRSVYIKEDETI